jgi:predicted Fe-Mo cluster-binding NifX family protein
MKICLCATGPDLDSQISPVFGRCPYFLIVNSESKEFKAIPNLGIQTGRGAGVAAAQTIISEKAGVVICGNFGPNASSVLQMSGIKIYPGVFGLTIKGAINKYNKGELKEMKIPSVPGRFGFGPGLRRRRRGR